MNAWHPIKTAPMDGTEFLAWFQKHKLDDDDNMTDEVIGGARAITSFSGGLWNEPEWLGAHGSYFMEDWCFAEKPVLWHELPPIPTEGDCAMLRNWDGWDEWEAELTAFLFMLASRNDEVGQRADGLGQFLPELRAAFSRRKTAEEPASDCAAPKDAP